jgi:hypothetical protein
VDSGLKVEREKPPVFGRGGFPGIFIGRIKITPAHLIKQKKQTFSIGKAMVGFDYHSALVWA